MTKISTGNFVTNCYVEVVTGNVHYYLRFTEATSTSDHYDYSI